MNKYKSLETLAVELKIPKILSAKDANEVLTLGFKDLKEKYDVTPEEFVRIKEYKNSLCAPSPEQCIQNQPSPQLPPPMYNQVCPAPSPQMEKPTQINSSNNNTNNNTTNVSVVVQQQGPVDNRPRVNH
ncbi:hypothetical protein HDU92_008519, partial [Lobulomyces angularis]